MQDKINSSLYIVAASIFLILYPFYLIWTNFNLEQVLNLWKSIVEYKYRILLVIIVHLLIIMWKTLQFKKPKILNLFFIRRKPIITIIIFIYPLLPDFLHRFGKISENNVTDFYAIFMPIFIMFIVMSVWNTWDPIFLKEMKDNLSIKSNTNRKINFIILNFSKSIMISAYAFLFLLLIYWMSRNNKVNPEYEETFWIFPMAFFCFFFGLNLLLNIILDSKPDIKATNKSDINNTHIIKNSAKKDSNKNIKVNFK